MKFLTTRERYARSGPVFKRLATRLLKHHGLECKLGHEPQQRRSDKCSACSVKTDLEIDHSVARLISDRTIAGSTQCPYLAFSQALMLALLLGPEAMETAKQSERVRITELNIALEHIRRALKTLAGSREDMDYLAEREDEELFGCLDAVFGAETIIAKAVEFLTENFERNHGHKFDPRMPEPAKRGRRPDLAIRSVVRPCIRAWRTLTGTEPGKNNVRFHGVLRAAAVTILGRLDREPDWEGQIVAVRSEKAVGEK
jgi:hypothetical protein